MGRRISCLGRWLFPAGPGKGLAQIDLGGFGGYCYYSAAWGRKKATIRSRLWKPPPFSRCRYPCIQKTIVGRPGWYWLPSAFTFRPSRGKRVPAARVPRRLERLRETQPGARCSRPRTRVPKIPIRAAKAAPTPSPTVLRHRTASGRDRHRLGKRRLGRSRTLRPGLRSS